MDISLKCQKKKKSQRQESRYNLGHSIVFKEDSSSICQPLFGKEARAPPPKKRRGTGRNLYRTRSSGGNRAQAKMGPFWNPTGRSSRKWTHMIGLRSPESLCRNDLEAAWLSGYTAGFEIRRSRFKSRSDCYFSDVVLSNPEFNFSPATPVNSQLVYLLPVGILSLAMFNWILIFHCLFTFVLKSPNGEWPIAYT